MKKYFILAAVAATFAACSFDKDLGESSSQIAQEKIPLMIAAANVSAPTATRGITTNYQSDALVSDNTLGLYIRKSGNTSTKSESYEFDNLASTALNANTYGTTSCVDVNTGTTSLYYPDVKTQEICLYAYAPTSIFASAPTSITTGSINVSTIADQTTEANYRANDIIWGSQGTSTDKVSASAQAAAQTVLTSGNAGDVSGAYIKTNSGLSVKIPMEHKASKIIVNLIPNGMVLSKLVGATVKFYVDYTQGTFNLSNGAITSTTLSALQPITLTTTLGKDANSNTINTYTEGNGGYSAGSSSALTDFSTDNSYLHGYSCSAIILPQKVNGGANGNTPSSNVNLIEVYIDANTSYIFKTSSTHTYEAGKVYTYNINVNASGLTVTTTVGDWTPGAETPGNAELQ